MPNEACTIKADLKGKLQYKSSVLSLNVRPHKVVQTAKGLINNSALYKEGIALCEKWQNSQKSDFDNSVHDKSVILRFTPYFEKAKRDLFAMIRQLGPATLFCSFCRNTVDTSSKSSSKTSW